MFPWTTREESGVQVVTFDESTGLSGLRDQTRRDAIYSLIPDCVGPRVVLNLEKVDYLSSFGVATLIGIKRRVEERGGKLILCSVHPVVRELLSMMNLDPLFVFAEDESSAISSVSSSPTA
jgi:anti-anti-sigma factor